MVPSFVNEANCPAVIGVKEKKYFSENPNSFVIGRKGMWMTLGFSLHSSLCKSGINSLIEICSGPPISNVSLWNMLFSVIYRMHEIRSSM